MEELKMLIEMVQDLPSLAIWLIGFYFFYKLFVIGSVYATVRLGIIKAHSVLTNHKEKPIVINWGNKVHFFDDVDRVQQAMRDVAGGDKYLHSRHANFIINAIAEKIDKDGLP